jgi:hypothetical protein
MKVVMKDSWWLPAWLHQSSAYSFADMNAVVVWCRPFERWPSHAEGLHDQ